MHDRRRIKDTNDFNYMTSSIVDKLYAIEFDETKMIIVNSLRYCQKNKGLEIARWVIMSNHFHLIARASKGYKLAGIMRDFKGFTAVQLRKHYESIDQKHAYLIAFRKKAVFNRKNNLNQIWQEGLYAAVVKSMTRFQQKLDYIHANPVKAGLVQSPTEYLWSSARDYCGEKGMLEICSVSL